MSSNLPSQIFTDQKNQDPASTGYGYTVPTRSVPVQLPTKTTTPNSTDFSDIGKSFEKQTIIKADPTSTTGVGNNVKLQAANTINDINEYERIKTDHIKVMKSGLVSANRMAAINYAGALCNSGKRTPEDITALLYVAQNDAVYENKALALSYYGLCGNNATTDEKLYSIVKSAISIFSADNNVGWVDPLGLVNYSLGLPTMANIYLLANGAVKGLMLSSTAQAEADLELLNAFCIYKRSLISVSFTNHDDDTASNLGKLQVSVLESIASKIQVNPTTKLCSGTCSSAMSYLYQMFITLGYDVDETSRVTSTFLLSKMDCNKLTPYNNSEGCYSLPQGIHDGLITSLKSIIERYASGAAYKQLVEYVGEQATATAAGTKILAAGREYKKQIADVEYERKLEEGVSGTLKFIVEWYAMAGVASFVMDSGAVIFQKIFKVIDKAFPELAKADAIAAEAAQAAKAEKLAAQALKAEQDAAKSAKWIEDAKLGKFNDTPQGLKYYNEAQKLKVVNEPVDVAVAADGGTLIKTPLKNYVSTNIPAEPFTDYETVGSSTLSGASAAAGSGAEGAAASSALATETKALATQTESLIKVPILKNTAIKLPASNYALATNTAAAVTAASLTSAAAATTLSSDTLGPTFVTTTTGVTNTSYLGSEIQASYANIPASLYKDPATNFIQDAIKLAQDGNTKKLTTIDTFFSDLKAACGDKYTTIISSADFKTIISKFDELHLFDTTTEAEEAQKVKDLALVKSEFKQYLEENGVTFSTLAAFDDMFNPLIKNYVLGTETADYDAFLKKLLDANKDSDPVTKIILEGINESNGQRLKQKLLLQKMKGIVGAPTDLDALDVRVTSIRLYIKNQYKQFSETKNVRAFGHISLSADEKEMLNDVNFNNFMDLLLEANKKDPIREGLITAIKESMLKGQGVDHALIGKMFAETPSEQKINSQIYGTRKYIASQYKKFKKQKTIQPYGLSNIDADKVEMLNNNNFMQQVVAANTDPVRKEVISAIKEANANGQELNHTLLMDKLNSLPETKVPLTIKATQSQINNTRQYLVNEYDKFDGTSTVRTYNFVSTDETEMFNDENFMDQLIEENKNDPLRKAVITAFKKAHGHRLNQKLLLDEINSTLSTPIDMDTFHGRCAYIKQYILKEYRKFDGTRTIRAYGSNEVVSTVEKEMFDDVNFENFMDQLVEANKNDQISQSIITALKESHGYRLNQQLLLGEINKVLETPIDIDTLYAKVCTTKTYVKSQYLKFKKAQKVVPLRTLTTSPVYLTAIENGSFMKELEQLNINSLDKQILSIIEKSKNNRIKYAELPEGTSYGDVRKIKYYIQKQFKRSQGGYDLVPYSVPDYIIKDDAFIAKYKQTLSDEQKSLLERLVKKAIGDDLEHSTSELLTSEPSLSSVSSSGDGSNTGNLELTEYEKLKKDIIEQYTQYKKTGSFTIPDKVESTPATTVVVTKPQLSSEIKTVLSNVDKVKSSSVSSGALTLTEKDGTEKAFEKLEEMLRNGNLSSSFLQYLIDNNTLAVRGLAKIIARMNDSETFVFLKKLSKLEATSQPDALDCIIDICSLSKEVPISSKTAIEVITKKVDELKPSVPSIPTPVKSVIPIKPAVSIKPKTSRPWSVIKTPMNAETKELVAKIQNSSDKLLDQLKYRIIDPLTNAKTPISDYSRAIEQIIEQGHKELIFYVRTGTIDGKIIQPLLDKKGFVGTRLLTNILYKIRGDYVETTMFVTKLKKFKDAPEQLYAMLCKVNANLKTLTATDLLALMNKELAELAILDKPILESIPEVTTIEPSSITVTKIKEQIDAATKIDEAAKQEIYEMFFDDLKKGNSVTEEDIDTAIQIKEEQYVKPILKPSGLFSDEEQNSVCIAYHQDSPELLTNLTEAQKAFLVSNGLFEATDLSAVEQEVSSVLLPTTQVELLPATQTEISKIMTDSTLSEYGKQVILDEIKDIDVTSEDLLSYVKSMESTEKIEILPVLQQLKLTPEQSKVVLEAHYMRNVSKLKNGLLTNDEKYLLLDKGIIVDDPSNSILYEGYIPPVKETVTQTTVAVSPKAKFNVAYQHTTVSDILCKLSTVNKDSAEEVKRIMDQIQAKGLFEGGTFLYNSKRLKNMTSFHKNLWRMRNNLDTVWTYFYVDYRDSKIYYVYAEFNSTGEVSVETRSKIKVIMKGLGIW